MRDALALITETELYAFNRRQMFGLFPTYSIGISLPALFGLSDLSELHDIFFFDE